MFLLQTCGNGYVDCDGNVLAHQFDIDQYCGNVQHHETGRTYCQGNYFQQSCNDVQGHQMVHVDVSTGILDQIAYYG